MPSHAQQFDRTSTPGIGPPQSAQITGLGSVCNAIASLTKLTAGQAELRFLDNIVTYAIGVARCVISYDGLVSCFNASLNPKTCGAWRSRDLVHTAALVEALAGDAPCGVVSS